MKWSEMQGQSLGAWEKDSVGCLYNEITRVNMMSMVSCDQRLSLNGS